MYVLWLSLIVAKAEARGRFLKETALCRKTREVLVGGAAAVFGVLKVLEWGVKADPRAAAMSGRLSLVSEEAYRSGDQALYRRGSRRRLTHLPGSFC